MVELTDTRDIKPEFPPKPGETADLSPDVLAAYKTARSIKAPLPEIKGDEDFANIRPGQRFIGPDKQVHTKLFEVSSDEDFDVVPEGAQFIGPDKKVHTKQRSQGIGYTAQTLYDMSSTDSAREQVLRKFFGDKKVKRDTMHNLYVEDDGVLRRPGARDLPTSLGTMTAETAPAIGMVGGGAVGGMLDIETGVVPGAVAGSIGGAMAGRQFNNIILGLAGIHQGLGEQLSSMAWEGAGVAGGEVAGKVLGKTLMTIPAAISAARRGATGVREGLKSNLPDVLDKIGLTPDRVRKLLGTSKEVAERAHDISQQGGRVPLGILAPESPMLRKIEEFDAVFRAQNVVGQANEKYYNQQVRKILEDKELGIHLDEEATRATKKVSSQRAGRLVLDAAIHDRDHAVAELENAVRDAKAQARLPIEQAGGEKQVAQLRQQAMDRLAAAQQRSIETAQNLLQASMRDLRGDIDESIRLANADQDTDALNRLIAAKFRAHNVALRLAAKQMYDAGDAATGGLRIEAAPLADDAKDFIARMPEQLRAKYPSEIRDLARMAREPKEGDEPIDTTFSFGELRHLRSWFRYGIDYNDLTPDMKAGSLKLFEKKINSLLHQTRDDIQKLPEGLHFESGPMPTHFMEQGPSSGRRITIVDKNGTEVFSLSMLPRNVIVDMDAYKSTPGGAGLIKPRGVETRYYIQKVDNRSRWLSESGEGTRYKNLAEAAYIKAASLAKSEGRILISGGSESTSQGARMIQQKLVDKGYALPFNTEGQFKILSERESSPLEQAAQLLDKADAFYKQNIPFLSDQMVQGTIDLLRSGAGVNAPALADMLFDPARTAAMRRVRGIVGENLWKAVQAAHLQKMLDSSRIIGTGQLDAEKFAKLVEDEARNGLLGTAYDDVMAHRLEKITTDIRRLNGSIPISTEPGDTISTLMRKAEVAKAQIEKFAELDPLKALAQETSRIDREFNLAQEALRKQGRSQPLGFLNEPSMLALEVKAADRILGSQDLIMASLDKFGRDSPEFLALQKVYVTRFFQRPFGRTAHMRGELADPKKGITEEVQALMFPGVTRDAMIKLADNMEFLFSGGGSDVGGSMAAASRVLHPGQSIPIPHLQGFMSWPGVSFGTRIVLGRYFATIVDALQNPHFVAWLANKLGGDETSRLEARMAVQNRLRLGGWFSHTFGAAYGQTHQEQIKNAGAIAASPVTGVVNMFGANQ